MLGPLRVWDGAAWSQIRRPQQRAVLAILLIEAGHVVPTERLVDEIWGERPPRAAVGTVHNNVMRLRKLLGKGADGPLLTRGRGYELALDPDRDVDTRLFARLVEAGRRDLAEGRLASAASRLAEGLALWCGAAMADVPETPTVTAHAAGLELDRLTALEDRFGVELALGRHADVADELRRLVDEHPFRERLWAHLMLARYRCGRRAEALEVFHHARGLLVTELGLEPGWELRELQRAILADDPDGAAAIGGSQAIGGVRPGQLPAEAAGFTGRDAVLDQLNRLVAQQTVPRLAMIDGVAGVGKTALAIHWGHQVRDMFPDGQLYVNLRGYAPEPPVRPIEALARFLPSFGVPADQVPAEVDAAAALYRSLLADKKVLVLLDNANEADQIRPLLPASPGCLVVVTSRDQLRGLVARDGATRLTLGVLTADEAQRLLALMLGAERAADADAIARLARLCGYLPLALRIAAANITAHAAAHPDSTVDDYAAALAAGDRLRSLAVHGDPHTAVRSAFDQSYHALQGETRRLFRLLGLVPGPDFTVPAAAALAGVATAHAAVLIDQLVATHLVEGQGQGRFVLHDLLRCYAAAQSRTEDGQPDPGAALGRLFDHYLTRVDAAARRLFPQMVRLPMTGRRPGDDFAGAEQASAWLSVELPNLVAAVQYTAEHGPHPVAWRLADALRGYLATVMHPVELAATATAGLAAANADGDLSGQAASHLAIAHLCFAQGRYRQAIAGFTRSAALARRVRWIEGESACLTNLGTSYAQLGELARAVDLHQRALAIDRRIGRVLGQAVNLAQLGAVYRMQGRLTDAVESYQQAVALQRRTGSVTAQARILNFLAELHHTAGRPEAALETVTWAIELHRQTGDRNGEAAAGRILSLLYRDSGRLAEALELADTGAAVGRQTGDRWLEATASVALAAIHQRSGNHQQAVDAYRHALQVARGIGDLYTETEALLGLSAAEQEPAHAEQALDMARRAGYKKLEDSAGAILAEITRLRS